LSDINLKLQIGKQYAFVGPSGSGKTTLADVCLGLIRPDSGHVFFSSGLTKDSVCYVPQSVELAVGSIAQNVALEWNKADIDMTRVNRALIESQLSELIISEESVESTGRPNLSGGQIQRLGIARILYRNPIFVVFDEATSALDAQTENEIMKLLDSLRKEITVVLIAHRLTTIQNADQIIYIDNGKIEGVGSFEELRIQIPAFAKQIELGSLLTLPKNVSKIRLP
jgi:ATP-binding cassette subfamily C protein